jgi:hypothetical protein
MIKLIPKNKQQILSFFNNKCIENIKIDITIEIFLLGTFRSICDSFFSFTSKGKLVLNNFNSLENDFIICEDKKILKINVEKEVELFIIKTPKVLICKSV